MDYGAPISYMVLAEGTPVLTSDGERVGEVERVLAEPDVDVFDGVIIATPQGARFVDADHAGDLYERAMVLSLSAQEARHLPDPTGNPAVVDVDPEDTVERSPGEQLGDALRRAWNLVSGKY